MFMGKLTKYIFGLVSLGILIIGLMGRPVGDWFVSLLVFGLLCSIAWIDMRTMRIPNVLNAGLFMSGLGWGLWSGSPVPVDMLSGAIAGFGVLWLIGLLYQKFRGRAGIGMGDAKFLCAAGVWTGPFGLPFVLLVASTAGLIFAFTTRLVKKSEADFRHVALPFGPFLALGLWITLTWGYVLIP